jgi:hypothetical protein
MPISRSANDFLEIVTQMMFDAESGCYMIQDPMTVNTICQLCEIVAVLCQTREGARRLDDDEHEELAKWHERFLGEEGDEEPRTPTLFIS